MNKKSRGILILTIAGLVVAGLWMYFQFNIYVYWALEIGITLLLVRRIFKKEPKEGEPEPNNLLNVGNKTLGKVPMKVMLEGQMLGLFWFLLYLVGYAIYYVWFTDSITVMKWIVGLNGFFGMLFLSASIAQTFSTYKNLDEITKLQENMKGMMGGLDVFNSMKNDNPDDKMKGGANVKTKN